MHLALGHGISTATTLPAFPGAVGYGHHALGGRGGDVVVVTTIADNGPGSLRAALGNRKWRQGEITPITVVFRVSGIITLESPLWINQPYVTIAGQSAPGGGITLRTTGKFDGPALGINSHNIIVRHLRVRPARAPSSSCCGDAMVITAGHDIIIDHCSLSWGTDEVLDIWYRSRRITIQHTIVAEGRRNHNGGISGKGILIGADVDQVTLYGNLIAHHLQRSPKIGADSPGTYQVVNNVIYNWRHFGSVLTAYPGPARVNLIGNYYRSGPETRMERFEILVGNRALVYARGNLGPRRPINSLPDWNMVGQLSPDYNRPALTIGATTAFPGPPLPILPAATAYQQTLQTVGAYLPTRDSVDSRLINEVLARRSSLFPPPESAEQWPPVMPGISYADTDRDGMEDRWELQHRLNPQDPQDRNGDLDGDGYTNLEEFLNATRPR